MAGSRPCRDEEQKLRRSRFVKFRGAMEDLDVDLGEDASVGAESGRNVLAAKEEANGAVE